MENKEKSGREWVLPGWPWELELLSLVFVIVALVVPFMIHNMPPGDPGTGTAVNPATVALQEQQGLIWSVSILGLYFLQILFTRGAVDLLSTPVTSMLGPLIFAALAYYRILDTARATGRSLALASGSIGQILLFGVIIVIVTVLLARLRMARFMLNFRDTRWDVSSPPQHDGTFVSLLSEVRPLIYLPRMYRASEQGILIEGWFYVMAIPFKMVQSIGAMVNPTMTSAGNYFATSTQTLIRLELTESNVPFYVSPAQRDEFLKYCANHVVRLKRGTASGTHGGIPGALGRTQRLSLGQTQRVAASQTQRVAPAATPPTARSP